MKFACWMWNARLGCICITLFPAETIFINRLYFDHLLVPQHEKQRTTNSTTMCSLLFLCIYFRIQKRKSFNPALKIPLYTLHTIVVLVHKVLCLRCSVYIIDQTIGVLGLGLFKQANTAYVTFNYCLLFIKL